MTARLDAATAKLKRFQGRTCNRCQTSEKWTSSGACVQCSKDAAKARADTIRQLLKGGA